MCCENMSKICVVFQWGIVKESGSYRQRQPRQPWHMLWKVHKIWQVPLTYHSTWLSSTLCKGLMDMWILYFNLLILARSCSILYSVNILRPCSIIYSKFYNQGFSSSSSSSSPWSSSSPPPSSCLNIYIVRYTLI